MQRSVVTYMLPINNFGYFRSRPGKMERCRVEGAIDFDMTVGMNRSLTGAEERERFRSQRLQRRFFDLEKVGHNLAPGCTVNAQPGNGAVPAPEMFVMLAEAVEAATFEGVVLNVPTAALLLAVLLRIARARRQRREVPMTGEGCIDLIDIRVIKTCPNNGSLLIVMSYDLWNTSEVGECVLVQAEEGLKRLIPDGLLITMPRVTQGQPEHPGTFPLATGFVQRRSSLEEVHLAFFTRGAMKHAHRSATAGQFAYETLDRFVTATEPVLFDKVLPDALNREAGIQFGDDRVPVRCRRRSWRQSRAGEHFGRI
jgi:hypothetical protein